MQSLIKRLLFVGVVLLVYELAFSAQPHIAGTKPDQRRPNAPVIKQGPKLVPEKVLQGASENIPPSLRKAIQSQGNWFTPLTRAGMTGPYDIRGYHNTNDVKKAESYIPKQWDPIHFPPKIYTATNQQCLACHQEIMDRKILDVSQAGVKAVDSLAWYQTLDTYKGPQADFHWRHLESPYATRVMKMQCTTCHQGNDPREEAWVPPTDADHPVPAFTLRKMVNPKTCLLCHGQFPDAKIMNLPGPWHKIRDAFQNNCLSCHTAFRTNRHQVNYLNPEAIEAAGKESGDSCYGCHGGRAWYRISYPYPRHAWPNMPPGTPEWAKDRLTQSEKRFLNNFIESSSQEKGK